MLIRNTPIVALATPVGLSALAVIRASGANILKVADTLFKGTKKLTQANANEIVFGHIINPLSLKAVDQVLISVFCAPKSFTGEDMVEISCHGGVILYQQILDLLINQGCSLAEPGEFSKRAFYHHKMDLTQAEAIHDLIFSKSPLATGLILATIRKTLNRELEAIKQDLVSLIAKIEVNIDYPEDDLEDFSPTDIHKLKAIITKTEELIAQGQRSRQYNQGYKVGIVGKPNAGKSSLINVLAGEDKAIVSDIEGTTRDCIEVTLTINNLPITFVDTAGLRDNPLNIIEEMGIAKTKDLLKGCDLLLILKDSSAPTDTTIEDQLTHKGLPYLIVFNKGDLAIPPLSSPNSLVISCVTGEGIPSLITTLGDVLHGVSLEGTHMYLNIRQDTIISNIRQALIEAHLTIMNNESSEIVSFILQKALGGFSQLDGSDVGEEILSHIFSQFCVGK